MRKYLIALGVAVVRKIAFFSLALVRKMVKRIAFASHESGSDWNKPVCRTYLENALNISILIC